MRVPVACALKFGICFRRGIYFAFQILSWQRRALRILRAETSGRGTQRFAKSMIASPVKNGYREMGSSFKMLLSKPERSPRRCGSCVLSNNAGFACGASTLTAAPLCSAKVFTTNAASRSRSLKPLPTGHGCSGHSLHLCKFTFTHVHV